MAELSQYPPSKHPKKSHQILEISKNKWPKHIPLQRPGAEPNEDYPPRPASLGTHSHTHTF